MKASAFEIREAYSAAPLSSSAFVVDLLPESLILTTLVDQEDHQETPNSGYHQPSPSSWSSTSSTALPLERYRHDSQRHERVAVSVALGRACHLTIAGEQPVFRRSAAPSPSSRRELGVGGVHHELTADAATAQSVIDPDEHDHQGPYSLERWFGSTMEKADEIAVELQQAGDDIPQPARSADNEPTTVAVTKHSNGETHQETPTTSSISLECIAADTDANNNIDNDESLGAFTMEHYKQFVIPPQTSQYSAYHRWCILTSPTGPRKAVPIPIVRTKSAVYGGIERGRARKTIRRADHSGLHLRGCQITSSFLTLAGMLALRRTRPCHQGLSSRLVSKACRFFLFKNRFRI